MRKRPFSLGVSGPEGMSERAPENLAAPLPNDDCVITFRTERSRIRGRLVRLGAAADHILKRHAMPDAITVALGEALSLVSLFGSALPGDGKIILQTKTDGAVSSLVADFASVAGATALRGYARYDAEALARREAEGSTAKSLLGHGSMAVTIDQGGPDDRYQAITAVDGPSLSAAAATYFQDRNAMPALVRLAVAQLITSGDGDMAPQSQWRSAGLLMQPSAAEAPANDGDVDAWPRVRILAETVEDHEMLDPTLSPERLLLRLFAEEGVRIERVSRLNATCSCSRERIAGVLKSFSGDEISNMRDEAGRITVTCEFCNTSYVFDAADIRP